MSEDWKRLILESTRVLEDKEGHSYEYSHVEFFLHPSGKTIRRYEHLHVDADESQVHHSWLESAEAEQAMAAVRARQVARGGKPAFFALGGGGASAPSSDPFEAALRALCQRSDGFVIAEDAVSGRFVQFAGGVGEPLTLDAPNLSPSELARAGAAFAGQPFQINEWEGHYGFNLTLSAPARAASAARRFFAEVFGSKAPRLSFRDENDAPRASSAPAGEVVAQLGPALQQLLARSGGFVIAQEASGRFVQFAGGVGEPLLLDVPNLSGPELARAGGAFAGQPFSINEWEGKSSFNLAFGSDARAAAEAAQRFFVEVFQIPAPSVTLETD